MYCSFVISVLFIEIATVLAAPIATIVGLTFDGTPRPLALGILVLSIAGYVLMLAMYRVEARQTA